MTKRYTCGLLCSDGGDIHTLRRAGDDQSWDWNCLDCGMKVKTGDRQLGSQVGEEVL